MRAHDIHFNTHTHGGIRPCDACQEQKDGELWTAVSGLLALFSRAYRNFSLWHHEFIKATRSAALVVLSIHRSGINEQGHATSRHNDLLPWPVLCLRNGKEHRGSYETRRARSRWWNGQGRYINGTQKTSHHTSTSEDYWSNLQECRHTRAYQPHGLRATRLYQSGVDEQLVVERQSSLHHTRDIY